MNNKKIVVCLDVKNGKTTKGVKFQNNEDLGDPIEMAAKYAEDGADEIVVYDITASIEGRTADLSLVKEISCTINVPLMVGGGISTVDDIGRILEVGASKVSINSPAVRNSRLISDAVNKFGSKAVSLGVDAMRDGSSASGYSVYIGGGKVKTGKDLLSWVTQMEDAGVGEIILNSIDADGTQNGYDCDMLRTVKNAVSVPLVASGGAGSLSHVLNMFRETNVETALVASIVHYGIVTVSEIKLFLKENGVNVSY